MNGEVDLSQRTKYRAKASFTCKTGYTLVGLPSPTCNSAGTWSSAVPVCQIKGMYYLPDVREVCGVELLLYL
ncbi:hypothetical protein DPMN_148011 [Dreissena polymorpha]|uniref:Sushi domain-containing protein n=1 Tax=Dreissena polymorpha TaxID=45954 RepID=A0A9D4J3G8_DREPO|nr:hypothetical protein DPMN_148011 [Dreissena polymorpha]